jgi:hypothetical protein
MEWVGSDDRKKILSAVMLLCQVGPPVVEFLIAEAAKPTTSLTHKYRLLDLARRIGGRRGPVENRQLRELRRHKCSAIRAKAEEVLAALSPRRKPRTTSYRRLGRGSLAVAQEARRGQARTQSRPSKVSAAGMPIASSGG